MGRFRRSVKTPACSPHPPPAGSRLRGSAALGVSCGPSCVPGASRACLLSLSVLFLGPPDAVGHIRPSFWWPHTVPLCEEPRFQRFIALLAHTYSTLLRRLRGLCHDPLLTASPRWLCPRPPQPRWPQALCHALSASDLAPGRATVHLSTP